MNYYTIYKVYGRMIPEHSGMFFPCFHFYYSCFWEAFALSIIFALGKIKR